MIKNALDQFSEDVFLFLTNKPKTGRNLLVKKHSENVHQHGEFSFPNTLKSWHDHLDAAGLTGTGDATLLSYIGKETSDISLASKNWALEVAKVKEDKGRIHMFLDRPKSISIGLLEALSYNIDLSDEIRESTRKVSQDMACEDDSLTSLRLKYLTKSIQNLYSIHSSRSKSSGSDVVVTSKSMRKVEKGAVLCGAVLNAKTGAKETGIKADDYIRYSSNLYSVT